jgi:hypothetical protein
MRQVPKMLQCFTYYKETRENKIADIKTARLHERNNTIIVDSQINIIVRLKRLHAYFAWITMSLINLYTIHRTSEIWLLMDLFINAENRQQNKRSTTVTMLFLLRLSDSEFGQIKFACENHFLNAYFQWTHSTRTEWEVCAEGASTCAYQIFTAGVD